MSNESIANHIGGVLGVLQSCGIPWWDCGLFSVVDEDNYAFGNVCAGMAGSDETVAMPRSALADLINEASLGELPPLYEDVKSMHFPFEVIPHACFSQKFVLHMISVPALVLACSKDGEDKAKQLFGEAITILESSGDDIFFLEAFQDIQTGSEDDEKTSLVLVPNQGIYIAAETLDELRDRLNDTREKLASAPELNCDTDGDRDLAELGEDELRWHVPAAVLRSRWMQAGCSMSISSSFQTKRSYKMPSGKGFMFADELLRLSGGVCHIEDGNDLEQETRNAFDEQGEKPPTLALLGDSTLIAAGKTPREAKLSLETFRKANIVRELAEKLGGTRVLSEDAIEVFQAWISIETVELSKEGRAVGKNFVVTGGAQGFGEHIVRQLVELGGNVVVADLNLEGAKQLADELCALYGYGRCVALPVNIADEESVKKLVQTCALTCGGIDAFVANAGVLKAGSVLEMPEKDFAFVTDINYKGFFLCSKHCGNLMALQHRHAPKAMFDIVQINSKSGLVGSNKNGAYAGSKFGGIGLVQSFAMELVEHNIKVNAICPGNFYDGPLWSDPDRGLFRQYLDTGKVPGAKTVQEVRDFYEAKVPLRRGCFPRDVVRAILYLIEQEYETGQALPVTGGQEMVH